MNRSPASTKPPPANLVIRASAGSGKTFQLSNRFLDLVTRDVPVDEILASTFTRKAAGEIEDRVLLRLALAATDPKQLQELKKFLAADWLDESRCLDLLQSVVRQLHRLRISTLDSFFIQIAQGLILEMGLSAGWRIVDDVEDERLRELAINELLAREDQGDLNRIVNWLTKGTAQRSVAELIRSTVTSLYNVYLEAPASAWDKIPKQSRLTAEQLTELIDTLENEAPPEHKNAIKAHAKTIEMARLGDWEELPKAGLAAKVANGATEYSNKPLSDRLVQLYRKLLQHGAAEILEQIRAQTIATFELLNKFHGFYEQLKRERRALRFEDVTRHVGEYMAALDSDRLPTDDQKLLRERLARLAYRLDARIDHLLLDEFQDTSLAQWNVLRPLALHATLPHGLLPSDDLRSFFCVGDGKQAIYGWRGGVAEIFEALHQQLTGLASEPLNTSFRSAPIVIETVNQVFKNLDRHSDLDRLQKVVNLWSERFPLHSTAKTNYEGCVTLEVGPDTEEEGDAAFTKFAARRIAELTRQAPDCTVGVLVNSNKEIAELIFELRALQIPASEEGGNPLTDSASVQLIMSMLDLADHPGNSIARFHTLHSPLGVALQLPAITDNQGWAQLSADIRQRLMREGYGAVISSWTVPLAAHCDAREWRRLQQLVAAAHRYQPTATLRSSDFVEQIEKRRVADPSNANVVVTTIHKSKGLQYDIVVLPRLERPITRQAGSFVSGRRDAISPIQIVCRYISQDIRAVIPAELQQLFEASDAIGVTESLCLLYVALTRAVHALHLLVEPINNRAGNLPKTFAGLLRAALIEGQNNLEPNTVAYQVGQLDWAQRRAASKAVGGEQPAKMATPRQPPVLQPIQGGRLRGLPRVSPSSLAWRQHDAQRANGPQRARLRDQNDLGSPLGKYQGTILHAWLEEISWVEPSTVLPEDEKLRAIASRAVTMPLDDAWLTPLLHEWRQMMADSRLRCIWCRQDYVSLLATSAWTKPLAAALASGNLELDVYREQRFAYRAGDELVTGIIDRLVVLRHSGKVVAIEVLDYKSDDVPDDEAVAQKTQHYRPQLQQYREAMAETWKLPLANIRARLIFLRARRWETI